MGGSINTYTTVLAEQLNVVFNRGMNKVSTEPAATDCTANPAKQSINSDLFMKCSLIQVQKGLTRLQ